MNLRLPRFVMYVSGVRAAAASLWMRAGIVFICTLAVIAFPSGPAFAQAASASSVSSAKQPLCVDAEVDGVRSLSYDCLSRQLKPAATPEDATAGGTSVDRKSAAEALATQPSNRVGTFNLSAERNRFGSNWGKSAQPQRPAPPVAVPPVH